MNTIRLLREDSVPELKNDSFKTPSVEEITPPCESNRQQTMPLWRRYTVAALCVLVAFLIRYMLSGCCRWRPSWALAASLCSFGKGYHRWLGGLGGAYRVHSSMRVLCHLSTSAQHCGRWHTSYRLNSRFDLKQFTAFPTVTVRSVRGVILSAGSRVKGASRVG